MKYYLFILIIGFINFSTVGYSQNITYSEVEKADSRNMNFEILGNFSNNFLTNRDIKSLL